jgi:hypothetical protein
MNKKNLPLKQIFLFVLVFSLFSEFSFGQSCPSGMLSYWKLQESSGPVYNDSYGNHDALAGTAAPSQTAGISGKAQLFNKDASTYISVADHSDFDWAGTVSFSIELWVKFSGAGETRVLLGRDDPSTSVHWWIGQTPTGQIEWFIIDSNGNTGDLISNSSYNDGQWHHVVAVRDASANKIYLYVDGVSKNINLTLTGNLYSTANISIGCLVYDNAPDYYFSGSLDEIAVYNRALSSSEITAHYNNVRLYQIGYCSNDNPVILSTPVIYATSGQVYTYDVDASGNSTPIYSLVTKPTGMVIDQITGVITWTPSSPSVNGHVVVRATNNKGSVDQDYSIYISDVPTCRTNLVAYWDFSGTSSAPYYDNIDGWMLTGSGASHASGRVGSGLSFDGVNDSLNLKDSAEPSLIFFDFDNVPSFSIELWMKSNATPASAMVMIGRKQEGNNTAYYLAVQPDGSVEFLLRDYDLDNVHLASLVGGSVLNGAWHHIVGTYNASTNDMKLYVDKIAVAETNQSFENFGGNSDLNIGYWNIAGDKYWYQGVLDEIAVYGTALDESTIINNYNDGVAGEGACTYNYSPNILSSPVTSVNEDAPYYYQLVSTDINQSDVLTISAITKPTWLTFTYLSGDSTAVLSGTPTNSNVGLHNVTLRVSDGLISVDQSFQINVINVNDAPEINSSPTTSTNEDAQYTYTLTATDIDGDALTYSAQVIPDWMSFDAGTHILSGTPTNDNVGVFDITLRVTDGSLNDEQIFSLTVNNVNDIPEITSTPAEEIHANNAYYYEFTASDVDEGDVLTFSANTIPAWLTFTAGSNSGILIGTPAIGDIGSHAVILEVNDGHEAVLQGYSITVLEPIALTEMDNSIALVYPNPATDMVNFKFVESGSVRIEIYDITGTQLKQIESDNQGVIEVNITDLSNGVYLYKAYQNGKVSIGKITK